MIRNLPATMSSRSYTLNLLGDTMLGRLIDQLFPTHVSCPSEARIAHSFLPSHPHLQNYTPQTPWGDTLPLLHSADLTILNLETAATTHGLKWPNKVFNYRMHPANLAALRAARVSYAGLANNHTLDFCEEGLLETVRAVKGEGIAVAGAGRTQEEAERAAVLRLSGEHEVHIWAAADHPRDWAGVEGFHFIDYSARTRGRLKALLNEPPASRTPALKIFSVHWGPNYAWTPSGEIRELAHFLIDECGVDIVHGHSAHHVQGVEKYHGGVVMYGCGDFVDDYAVVERYRNDLGGVWRVSVGLDEAGGRLKLDKLEVFPTKIDKFAARRLRTDEADCRWVREKLRDLSAELGSVVDLDSSPDGRITIDLS